ncbi:helix-turn-helix domain-containing protein [Spirosoma utsteinense]|uniref:helix-turn-helix domain-containing protein n=1 Tax=Spirosoma utsteinense TaxID=2585773 RepID=UPI00164774DE|nr:helix-turn-helix domain-containing protein [Spirosoma utsteinense]MBC3787755.1 putative transposase [Spirosoma utsteinense]
MNLLKIRPGEAALYNGRLVIIKRVELTTTMAWCDYVDTGERVLVSFGHLNALHPYLPTIVTGSVPGAQDLAQISPEKLAKANWKKQMVLQAEVNANRTITPNERKQSVRQLAQAYGVHHSTLYRHIKTYNQYGREERYLVEKVRGGKGNKRTSPEVEKIIEQAIERIYLTREGNSKAAAYEEVRRLCHRNQIKAVPCYDTFRRRINSLADGTVVRRREGEKRYRARFHVSNGSVCDENDIPFPLHTAEIDSSPVDAILVDDYFRQPLGRPNLTLAIDVYSRMILGFHLSFDPVSADSVAQCIAHAVCPKERWLEQMGVEGQWPCWGIPERFRVDNGNEFRNGAYQAACNNYDIRIDWRDHVEDGAVIERLIGTSMRSIHQVPGTTQSNVQQKGDYNSQQEATLTLKAFERWFTWWVIKYNNQVHAGIGMPPLIKYLHAFHPPDGPPIRSLPDYITDTLSVRLDFAPYQERTIQRKGVVMEHIWYYDPLFKWLRHDHRDRKYVFRRLPGNVGSIWLRDPTTGEYVNINYANMNRPPMSIWELRAAQKRLKDRQIAPDEDAIFGAIEAMRTIVLEEQANRKTVRLTVTTNRILGLLYPSPLRNNPDPVPSLTTGPAKKVGETNLILPDSEVKPFGFLRV